jgi:ATP-dependent RNA helicase UAP56/SUB2
MRNPTEVLIENESKLTLHGLKQYYVELKANEKIKKLIDLIDALDFN